jgi:hypothetical protein
VCNVIGLVFIKARRLDVKIDPPWGATENPRSAIAASKAVQDTKSRASDLESRAEMVDTVVFLTLNCCAGSVTTIC